jgi:hypothetical protein
VKKPAFLLAVLNVLALLALPAALGSNSSNASPGSPQRARTVSRAVEFAVTPPLRKMPVIQPRPSDVLNEREHDPAPIDTGYSGDGALQTEAAAPSVPKPIRTFEGLRNTSGVAPPDPVGDVGPSHYVEMVNLSFAIYSKTGTKLFGPAALGTLWQDFLPDCEVDSGDPVVLYDELADRWLLSQFTTTGPEYFNCVAISTTGNPLGSYYLYAFSSGPNFPDYPKYGVWPDAYYITTREYAPGDVFVGVGIYAVDRAQMLVGNPAPRQVSFFLDRDPAYLPGAGLLPADLDGTTPPPAGSPEYLVGSMDDDYVDYGAPSDALNVFEVDVDWTNPPASTFGLTATVPISPFDTVFPCLPEELGNGRQCIPQPGTPTRLDILSYRQRPLWRLAYRNFGTHESLVTNQSVEAREGRAGIRWWELRSPAAPVLYQEGTYAPDDQIHRWMGSIAMDKQGNIALGFSVSNGIRIYPGIRYAGRLAGDPLGTMAQGERVMKAGSATQAATARWGDYTSMNVDPTDGCTFWYVNEYYAGTRPGINWKTRIGAFKFPGCS